MPTQQQAVRPVRTNQKTLDEKIRDANTNVDYYGKRIKYCSYFMGITGGLMALNGVYQLWTAKYNAQYIVTNHELPWGKPHQEMIIDGNAMSRDEFDLMDLFKSLGYLTLFISAAHMAVAKIGKKTLGTKKGDRAKKLFKKSIFTFALFFISYLVSKKVGKEMMEIFKKEVPSIAAKFGEEPVDIQEPPVGRNLKSWEEIFTKTTDQCKEDHSDESGCNADSGCVWCKCSAVPSSCFSVDDAKKLPSAVFQCDSKADQDSKKIIDELNNEYDQQESEDDEEKSEWRKKAYETFAPKLWKHAKGGDEKKKHCCGICPVMAVLILAGLYHHWQMWGYQKSLKNIEMYEKAKNVVSQNQSQAPQGVQQFIQPQKVMTYQQPTMSKKVEEAPLTFEPAINETEAPLNNESFDYSVSEPFIEEIGSNITLQIDDDIPESCTGTVNSQTNGMI